MGKLGTSTDEATLLKAYKISSLAPTTWEEVDHELEESVAGALTGPAPTTEADGDPLGLGSSIDLGNLDMESKASVLITSKSFDPKAFLSIAHPNATYQDLVSGTNHLRRTLDSRSEAIRVLVEENFDRFVAVKASTDALYADMKEGLLAPSAEFGSKPIRDHIKLGAQKANQVFLPALENAFKASKLRTTLGVFERSKFFFNLPGFLVESIEAGKYDVALRDYKKGKFLLESRPGQLLPLPSSNASNIKEAEAKQRKILDKVWVSVEKAMAELRNSSFAMLKDNRRSVEEHEKTIEILLELNTPEEPAWTYFDAQHAFIMKQMASVYESAVANVKAIRDRTVSQAPASEAELTTQLQICVAAMENRMGGDSVIACSAGFEIWTAVLDVVKGVSEVALTHLPNFWKIANSFLEGKLKRAAAGSTSRRSPTQVRSMALEILKVYISLLSEFFNLSDVAVMTTSQGPTTPPPLLPSFSNVLTTGHHLMKILGEMQDAVNEVNAIEIANEDASGLGALMESARWKFVEILISAWLRDAKLFYHLEAWVANSSETYTVYLSLIETFQRQVTTFAFKLAGGIELSSSVAKQTRQNPITPAFVAKIVKAFIDAMYSFLDGFLFLATRETATAIAAAPIMAHEKALVSQTSIMAATNRLELLDLDNKDIRLLLVMSNLDYLIQVLVPTMINQLETAFAVTIEDDRSALVTAAQELDGKLFDLYIKPKSEKLLKTVHTGILDSGIDWLDTPQPTEIRAYMFEALIYLVGIHAQVNATAENLLDRILFHLVEALADEAFQAFRTVRRFGMGGMLRATLEIEFMHQTLSRYVTPLAASTLSEVYNKISQAYTRRPGDENLQSNLDGVKKTLADTRRATGVEFLCFRNTINKDKDRGKSSSMVGSSKATKEISGKGKKAT